VGEEGDEMSRWKEDEHPLRRRENRIRFLLNLDPKGWISGLCEKIVENYIITDYKCTVICGEIKHPHKGLGPNGIKPWNYNENGHYRLKELDPNMGLTVFNFIIPDEISKQIFKNEGFVREKPKKGKVFWEIVYTAQNLSD